MAVTITSGVISHEDGKKQVEGDQFSPTRRSKCELTFTIPEGENHDDHIAEVAQKCQSVVHGMLGGKLNKPVPAAAPTGATKATLEAEMVARATGATQAATTAATAAARGPKRTAAPKTEPTGATAATAATAANAAAMVDDDLTTAPATQPAAAASLVDDDLTTAQPDPVSDADLNTAVQKKNAVLKDPPKIRGVIASFNPDPSKPFNLAQIPQPQRRAFLEKLDALK